MMHSTEKAIRLAIESIKEQQQEKAIAALYAALDMESYHKAYPDNFIQPCPDRDCNTCHVKYECSKSTTDKRSKL